MLVSRCIWENIGSTLKKRSRENNWPRHDRARHAAVPLLLRGAVAMGVLKYVATSPTRRGHTSRYKTCCEKTSSECDNQRASWMQASNLSDWQSRFIATASLPLGSVPLELDFHRSIVTLAFFCLLMKIMWSFVLFSEAATLSTELCAVCRLLCCHCYCSRFIL